MCLAIGLLLPDLIETLWNVKSFVTPTLFFAVPDLIETLWNVKTLSNVATTSSSKDLIETLWNVKASFYCFHVQRAMI